MSERRLRIAQVAPVGTPVGPGVGESVESLVAALCDRLTQRGHDVTLFATGDSRTTATLRSIYPRGYEEDHSMWDWALAEGLHAAEAFVQPDAFDVIHCHTHYGLPSAAVSRTPVVQTHHMEMGPELVSALRRCDWIHVVAVSEHQAADLAGRRNLSVIPHGVDVDAFPFTPHAGPYLMFLGRMIADKGPVQAAQIARTAGLPLILAGPPEDGFEEHIRPALTGPGIEYVGRVEPPERDRLLAGAAALLYPIQYPEPFGLVAIEAMACGTPVLATPVGAAPELIDVGLTGHVAGTVADLAALVPAALGLDRGRVRARARERFDISAMVDRHEALYQRVAA